MGLAVDLGTFARVMYVRLWVLLEMLFGFDWVGGEKVVGGGAWRNARACVVDWIDFF